MTDKPESAILLVAHGSRVETSNQEIAELAERLADRLGPGRMVRHAFLEMADPSIPRGIDGLVGEGARTVVVIPYFLSAGRHVLDDIPRLVDEARQRHPRVTIELTRHFGAEDGVPRLLSAMAVGQD